MARRNKKGDNLQERLVAINRVSKVIKGGRRFGFAALSVVGDGRGRVGAGIGKAREVPDAIHKSADRARKNLIFVPLREGRTIHHDTVGHFGAGRVILRSAPPGTGIIAGGPLRAIFESLGVQDVVAKSVGTQNNYNMVKATFDALERMASPRNVAARRGLSVKEVVGYDAPENENFDESVDTADGEILPDLKEEMAQQQEDAEEAEEEKDKKATTKSGEQAEEETEESASNEQDDNSADAEETSDEEEEKK
jgi:small subunit ribosomal protein S5